MNIIKLVLAGLVAAAIVLFSMVNNKHVLIDLGMWRIDIWLPLLVFVLFFLGIVPTWVWMAGGRMRLRRKLNRAEDDLAAVEQELAEAKVELLRTPGAPDVVVTETVSDPAAEI